jgi:hypothetical protein
MWMRLRQAVAIRPRNGCKFFSQGGLPSVRIQPAATKLLAPIAQLVERTAYTRRELRTGARLEVRILLGVPAASCCRFP